MAAPKRTQAEREADLAEMALLLAQGWTVRQLATHFGLSRSVAGRDAQQVRQQWQAAVAGELAAHRAEIVARLDWIFREALAAWDASKADRETTITKIGRQEVRLVDGTGKEQVQQRGAPTTITKRVSKGPPNHHYAGLALAATAERAKVLGVYAPPTLNVNVQQLIKDTAKELGMPEADLVAEMEEEFARVWAASEGKR